MTAGLPADQAPTVERAPEPRQLDLFLDGRDTILVHQVVTGLIVRDRDRAEAALERLREEHPFHPDLPALTQLVAALSTPPLVPITHATLTAAIDALENGLAPAARRLFGEDAPAFVQPLWRAWAARVVSLPFDDAYPRAHRSWLCQQSEDWPAVWAAVEAEPRWSATPCLRYRLGLARHHLGEPEAAIRLWLPLAWMDPALFAGCAPTLPSATLREGWQAFERAASFHESLGDPADATAWFPAWVLLRHRGLARLFRAEDVPDTGVAAQTFRQLLSLVPLEAQGLSDALVQRRRALRELSPAFFRYYMEIVAQRAPRG